MNKKFVYQAGNSKKS